MYHQNTNAKNMTSVELLFLSETIDAKYKLFLLKQLYMYLVLISATRHVIEKHDLLKKS